MVLVVSIMWNETITTSTPFTSRRIIMVAVLALIALLIVAKESADAFRFGIHTGPCVNIKQHRLLPFRCKTTAMIQLGSSTLCASHRALALLAMQQDSEVEELEEEGAFAVVNNRRTPPAIIALQPDDENDAMLEAVLDVAILASRRAAALISENAQGSVEVLETKSTNRDLLTRVDRMCEKIIQKTISTYFPHHLFLGEEGVVASGIDGAKAALEEKLAHGGWLWIVDPIDGTTNFASGIPINAPSVAVAYNGELMVGVIHDPHRNEEWTAIKGRGAKLNDEPFVVDSRNNSNENKMTIGDAVIGCESPAGQESLEIALRGIQALMPKCRTIRILGSTAIKMPWVAKGRLTCYWSPDECAWDHAAGAIIAQEAGAVVTDLDGSPFTLQTRKFMVSQNANVHRQVLNVLNEAGIQ